MMAAALLLALAPPTLVTRSASAFEWSGKLSSVAQGLKDSDPQVRINAIRNLASYDIRDTKKYLLPMLDDNDEGVRQEAARTLAKHKVEEAIKPVEQWLQAIPKATRIVAAQVLGEIGSPKAVSALSRTLADTEGDVRRECVVALGEIGGPTVVVPIIGRLDDDQVSVRKAAVDQLKNLGDKRAVIPLLERLTDSSKDVRITAIEAVGKLGDQSAAPALIRLLRDPMVEVRLAAVEALGLLKATDATEALIPLLDRGDEMGQKVAMALGRIGDARAVRELVVRLKSESLRLAAVEALKIVGTPAVPPLLDCLEGKIDDCEAQPVVDLLATLGDKRATTDLVAELQRSRVKKQKIVEALGKIGDPDALVPLLSLLDDKDPALRKEVLKDIEPMLDGRAADVLIKVLGDHDDDERMLAVDYLGVLSSKAAVPKLLNLTSEDTAAALRLSAIRALGRIGDPRASKTLVALVRDGKPDVRLEAADALANLKDPASVAPLLTLVADTGFGGRRAAITALRGPLRVHKDDKARKILEKLVSDQDPMFALDAIDALAAMGDAQTIPLFLKLAESGPRELRHAAIDALGDFGDASVEKVLDKALDDDDDAIRGSAAWSLGKLGLADATTRLVKAAHDQGFATQVNATAALARMGKNAPRDELLGLASHRNPYVRANAAIGLGRLGAAGDPARKVLVAMLTTDSHRYARVAAAHALGKIGGATDVLKAAAEKEEQRAVKDAIAAALTPSSDAEKRDDWVHIWWANSDGSPLKLELYVLIGADGLIKSGYTDVRGEANEEQFPRGDWDYQCLGQPGPDAYTTLDICRPAE
jgi:HEAT repeat protein